MKDWWRGVKIVKAEFIATIELRETAKSLCRFSTDAEEFYAIRETKILANFL